MDKHAQLEIRTYANIIGDSIVAKLWPNVWQAFLDYDPRAGNGMLLTAQEVVLLTRLLKVEPDKADAVISNRRELDEWSGKRQRLGVE